MAFLVLSLRAGEGADNTFPAWLGLSPRHRSQFSSMDGDTPSFRAENIKRVRNHFVPLSAIV